MRGGQGGGERSSVHAEVVGALLEAEILDDVGMLEVIEGVAFELESLHNLDVARISKIAGSPGDLDLLDSDDLAGGGVESEIDTAIATLADELAANPLEEG
jgi:hypothetical protein